MRIIGIGTDIVEISRIEALLERHPQRFAERILHAQELATFGQVTAKAAWLAKRFATKEAVAKARGCGFDGLNPLDITLRPDLGLAWIHNEETIPFHIWSRRQETDTWIALAYADIICHFPTFVGNKEGK